MIGGAVVWSVGLAAFVLGLVFGAALRERSARAEALEAAADRLRLLAASHRKSGDWTGAGALREGAHLVETLDGGCVDCCETGAGA